jgi:hypothetical protein
MASELQEYRYPARALLRDYSGAVIGLTVFGAPALFVKLSSVMVGLLGGLGLLFAVFALRTFVRQQSRILVDEEGIRVAGPWPQRLAWRDVSEVRLRFYSTWRDRTTGWMQLGVKGRGTAIRIDQAIGEFRQLAETTFAMTMKEGIAPDAATIQNAEALKLDLTPNVGDRAE